VLLGGGKQLTYLPDLMQMPESMAADRLKEEYSFGSL
jgi:hypothetical protein